MLEGKLRTKLLLAPLLIAWTSAQEPGAPNAYRTVVIATGGQRLLWTISSQQEAHIKGDTCSTVSVFNRTEGSLIWRAVESGDVGAEPGVRHVYSTARQGHKLSAISLSTGKEKWVFPKPSGIFSRHDPLDLPSTTTFSSCQETIAPGGNPSNNLPDPLYIRPMLRVRVSSPDTRFTGGPTEPGLVLVASQAPGNHLYAISEDNGTLIWQLALEPFVNITDVTLVDELPSLALLSISASSPEEGGLYGSMIAVHISNGTTHWATGPLTAGPPSVALATATDSLILRGQADADLVQTLYGLHSATGAVVWTKDCSLGCAVLEVDERTAIIASSSFSMNGLEAVNLTNGDVIWRGAHVSTEPQAECSGAVVAHRRVLFGCRCSAETLGVYQVHHNDDNDGHQQQGLQQSTQQQRQQQRRRLHKEEGILQKGENPLAGKVGGIGEGEGQGGDGGGDDLDGGELCGFAVSADDGSELWRERLGDRSSFPAAAADGGRALLPLVVGDTVLLATAAGVHALDRTTGKRRWAFKLPEGQEIRAWDFLDEQGGIVIVRSSGTPPTESRLYGIDLNTGVVRLDDNVPQSYVPSDSSPTATGLPYDLHDGVAYMDACSGSRCCLLAVDLEASAPPPTAEDGSVRLNNNRDCEQGEGQQQHGDTPCTAAVATVSGLGSRMRRRLQAALADGAFAALSAVTVPAFTSANGQLRLGGGDDGVVVGGGGCSTAAGRGFQYCVDVRQLCRAHKAKSIALEVIYVLLTAQLVVLFAGFGSVVIWRWCCRSRYVPYTRLNALPVTEVSGHDVASEDDDDDDEKSGEEDGVGARGGGGQAVGGVGLAVDGAVGVAVPIMIRPVARVGPGGRG